MINKLKKIVIYTINIIGILCLIYFAIPYIMHDNTIRNPNAMLATYSWDTCGFVLTAGLIPLIASNALAYYITKAKKIVKLLWFIPSIVCIVIVAHYLLVRTDWKEEEKALEPVATMKCSRDSNHYVYKIYLEKDNTYSLTVEDKDNFPLSKVDYTSKETIMTSIEEYYKSIGGMCP
jgi:hypothetical protein